MEKISKALSELSERLGPIKNAPIEVVRRLAHDDNIAVAEPVLRLSPRLASNDLVEIANTKTQAHLLAISGRSQLDSAVTDVLLERGDRNVMHQLADNSGARFSQNGFATLVKHSETDGGLAEKVGLRLDLPLQLFRQLLMRATEAVRSRLLALAGPENREHIQQVLATISQSVDSQAGIDQRSNAEAQSLVLAMRDNGQLDKNALLQFARNGQHAETIAALALLCSAPFALVENLMQGERREALLVPCKAAGLEWAAVQIL